MRSAPGFCPTLARSHSACPWQRLRRHNVPCHQARRNVTSWGGSGEYRRSWGARGENRPRNAARSRKTLKDVSAQVRGGRSRIDAGQRHQVDNFIANIPGSEEPRHGREVWFQGTEEMLGAFPDLKIDVQDIFGIDDKVTVLLRFRGTHLGAFQQFEATGRQVSFRSIEVYRIEGDRIAEEWVSPDMISLMQQISPALTDH
ncbi:ester cyclase [Streptomyces sp. ML-6]|uniref:ester cyclase n=1 Tax=Streptomyces sp. ML-6 TaxID=2982693 RepID=UPI0024C01997|nr:ester cyclase [Streptomyces sp. ML-6]MDK0523943.1 ester cyclase [Streptomyces sp. ML-6]